jgi:hypothetical protein
LSASWLTRTSATNSIDLTALTCGVIYYYTVQAVCGAAQSAVSQGSFSLSGCAATDCDLFPVRYFNVDLGDIGLTGSTCKKGNVWTVTGSGADIGGVSDAFQFAYTNDDIVDYDVTGRVTAQDATNTSNKVGIMVRDSLTNSSRFAYLASINNGYNIVFEYRDQPSAPATTIQIPGHYALPYWMKLSKAGTQFLAYISPDGANWTQVAGPIELNFGVDGNNAPHYGMAVTSANNTSLSSGTIDNFTVVGSGELPFRLQSFTAKKVNSHQILVSWSTSMEQGTDHFDVEKMTDNSGFQSIGTVKAAGNSQTPQSYSLPDNNPVPGLNAYRLKGTDLDGSSYYSPVVYVQMTSDLKFDIYPNPVIDYIHILSYSGSLQRVRLFDVSGKLLRDQTPGTVSTQINMSNLSTGIYFLSIKTAQGLYRQKLFKQ